MRLASRSRSTLLHIPWNLSVLFEYSAHIHIFIFLRSFMYLSPIRAVAASDPFTHLTVFCEEHFQGRSQAGDQFGIELSGPLSGLSDHENIHRFRRWGHEDGVDVFIPKFCICLTHSLLSCLDVPIKKETHVYMFDTQRSLLAPIPDSDPGSMRLDIPSSSVPHREEPRLN